MKLKGQSSILNSTLDETTSRLLCVKQRDGIFGIGLTERRGRSWPFFELDVNVGGPTVTKEIVRNDYVPRN